MWLSCPACDARCDVPLDDVSIEDGLVRCGCGAASRLSATLVERAARRGDDVLLERIERRIAEGELNLPTLPSLAAKIVKLTRDRNAGFQELASAIQMDPSLSAKLLQLANSSLYRGRIEAATVQQALSRLGMNTIRTVVVGLLSRDMYSVKTPAVKRFVEGLWTHAVECAVAAREVAKQSNGAGGVDAEVAFTAGLLHDIGKVVVLKTILDTAPQVARSMPPERLLSLCTRFHTTIGGSLLEAWGLSHELADVARKHHEQAALTPDPTGRLIAAVVCANALAKEVESGDHAAPLHTSPAAAALGIDEAGVMAVRERCDALKSELSSILS